VGAGVGSPAPPSILSDNAGGGGRTPGKVRNGKPSFSLTSAPTASTVPLLSPARSEGTLKPEGQSENDRQEVRKKKEAGVEEEGEQKRAQEQDRQDPISCGENEKQISMLECVHIYIYVHVYTQKHVRLSNPAYECVHIYTCR